jgi:PGF-CTERM protein
VLDQNANITANFSNVETGTYDFSFEVVDTSASAEDSIEVTEEEDVEAEFIGGNLIRATEADNIPVVIGLENTDHAQVNFGYNNVNFNLSFEVHDDDGDGQVSFAMDSYMLGRDLGVGAQSEAVNPGFAAANDRVNNTAASAISMLDDDDSYDTVGVLEFDPGNAGRDASIHSPPLDSNDYFINVTTGGTEDELASEGQVDGEQKAVGTVDLISDSTTGITSWTLPNSQFDEADDEEPSEFWEMLNNGEVTQSNDIAQGDALVWQVQTTSVFGALEVTKDDGESYEEAFIEMLGSSDGTTDAPSAPVSQAYDLSTNANLENPLSGSPVTPAVRLYTAGDFNFEVSQVDPGANQQPKTVDLLDTYENNGLNVIPDEKNQSVFISMREDRIELNRGSAYGANDALPTTVGETYKANFTIHQLSNINDETQFVSDEASMVEKSISFDTDQGDIIRVDAATNQTISGTTTVAPGTEIILNIQSTGDSPFFLNPTVVVQPDGTFSTQADFSPYPTNTSFQASAQGFDSTTPGSIGDAPTAAVTFSDQQSDGQSVTVDSATLSEGGFVAIHQGGADGQIIGTSSLINADAGQQTVTVQLDTTLAAGQEYTLVAMPHMDADGNGQFSASTDSAYQNGTAPVTDSANVTVESMTPPPTTDEPTTDEPTETTEEQDTEAPETTTTTGPGFGAALAVIALLGAALIAARRRA